MYREQRLPALLETAGGFCRARSTELLKILSEDRVLGSIDKGTVFIVLLPGDPLELHTTFHQNMLGSRISGKDFRLDAV